MLGRAPVLVVPTQVPVEVRQMRIDLVVALVPAVRLRHRRPALDLAPLCVDARQPVVEHPRHVVLDREHAAAAAAAESRHPRRRASPGTPGSAAARAASASRARRSLYPKGRPNRCLTRPHYLSGHERRRSNCRVPGRRADHLAAAAQRPRRALRRHSRRTTAGTSRTLPRSAAWASFSACWQGSAPAS